MKLYGIPHGMLTTTITLMASKKAEKIMQDAHDTSMESIAINCVSGLYTVTYGTECGEVQGLVLPTSTIPDEAYSKVEIDPATGAVKLLFDSAFMKDTTLLEADSDIYRMAAAHNEKTLMSISHVPGMEFGAEAELTAWARQCSSDKLRMFMGGDVCCPELVYCAANAASKVKDKTIVVSSCNIDVLNEVFTASTDTPLPDNFMLFVERPFAEKLCFAGFPDLLYSEAGGCCGDFAWWPERYEGCRMHINARSARMIPMLLRSQGALKREKPPVDGDVDG